MARSRKLYAGARVRELRAKERLTQAAFAERLGVSASYLNQIENNQRPLSAAVVLAVRSQGDYLIGWLLALGT